MGAVYLAEHPGIGRRVAVKVMHKNYTRDEHLLARFLNEARAANAIRRVCIRRSRWRSRCSAARRGTRCRPSGHCVTGA